MGRQPKEDRSEVKTIVVGVKLTEAEREVLARLVEIRSAEIAKVMGERIEATASGVLRWLLLEAAKARGIPTVAGESKSPPPEPEPPARPKAATKATKAAAKGKPAKGRGR
jgi:hypothetical protein